MLEFQVRADRPADRARARPRNDGMDQACSPSRERAALASAIQRYALWFRDNRATSLPVDMPLCLSDRYRTDRSASYSLKGTPNASRAFRGGRCCAPIRLGRLPMAFQTRSATAFM